MLSRPTQWRHALPHITTTRKELRILTAALNSHNVYFGSIIIIIRDTELILVFGPGEAKGVWARIEGFFIKNSI
jgi:hypothetical protein